jgi:hypothetical protein
MCFPPSLLLLYYCVCSLTISSFINIASTTPPNLHLITCIPSFPPIHQIDAPHLCFLIIDIMPLLATNNCLIQHLFFLFVLFLLIFCLFLVLFIYFYVCHCMHVCLLTLFFVDLYNYLFLCLVFWTIFVRDNFFQHKTYIYSHLNFYFSHCDRKEKQV